MIDSKKLVEELENATEWLARDYYQECHSAAQLIRELEAKNAALKARVAELERWVDCGQDGPCAKSPGCNRHWEKRNGKLVRKVRALQSQLAWTPFAEMMPEAPAVGETRRLLLGFTTGQILLCKELGGSWSHVESGARVGLDTARNMCAFWRYLTPPEASC